MCGIAGILRTWTAGECPPSTLGAIPEAWLDVLDESIKHRGPDGCGRFRQRVARHDGIIVDVALVHRRLSIIDHACGAQPMVIDGGTAVPAVPHQAGQVKAESREPRGSDSRATSGPLISREGLPYGPLRAPACPKCGPGVVATAFNGCIYNHRELRKELQSAGHEFFTDHSDTEVLLHGWREWGETLPERIEGMLACAAWDETAAGAFLARDQFGEKPLYVSLSHGIFAFASSPAGLVAITRSAGDSPRLDAQSLAEWIALGYAPERTPFAGVSQLASGGYSMPNGGVGRRPASALDGRAGASRTLSAFVPLDRGLASAASDVGQAIDRAVLRRIEADVPVACFLSGGVDSSLIALAASRHVQRLRTLCVRMPSALYDESEHARMAAEVIGSDHEEIESGSEPAENLLSLIPQLGLPFGDSSLLPTHWVSLAAAQHVGVAIGGDGGDELFLGYERYTIAGDLVPLQAIAMASVGLSPLLMARQDPKSASDKAARALTAARKRSYRSLLAIFQAPDLNPLLPNTWRYCRWDDRANSARLAQRYDLDNHLPGDLLRKVDTASMACALEVRSPMLDRELAQLTLRMPMERVRSGARKLVVSHGERKGLLRHIARKHFPRDLIDRPKMGFAIPVGEWFRSDYGGMRQLLYDHLESADPFPGLAEGGVEINMDFVRRMLREHDAAGEKSINPWHGRDHSQRLYMLLVLSIWCNWLRSIGHTR